MARRAKRPYFAYGTFPSRSTARSERCGLHPDRAGMTPTNRITEYDIRQPSETITFGEKESTSGHFWMDFLEGSGNDITELDQSRHNSQGRSNSASGGSVYAFVDGSV